MTGTDGAGFAPEELLDLRSVAVRAARAGSSVVARATAPGRTEAKAAGDYVTEVDRRSEQAIRAVLAASSPDIPVLGEEEGGRTGSVYWAVDPLDGTRNFLLGLPMVAVSVALVAGDRPVAGAIEAPLLGLSFAASLGAGAWAGPAHAERLAVSARPVRRAVVATGFPFRAKHLLPSHLAALAAVLHQAEDVRRPGAAALDLAWVAAGSFDGFFEMGLSVWDVAAGSLLVQEAGGVVTDWEGGGGYLSGDILAGSSATHAMLRRVTTSHAS